MFKFGIVFGLGSSQNREAFWAGTFSFNDSSRPFTGLRVVLDAGTLYTL